MHYQLYALSHYLIFSFYQFRTYHEEADTLSKKGLRLIEGKIHYNKWIDGRKNPLQQMDRWALGSSSLYLHFFLMTEQLILFWMFLSLYCIGLVGFF